MIYDTPYDTLDDTLYDTLDKVMDLDWPRKLTFMRPRPAKTLPQPTYAGVSTASVAALQLTRLMGAPPPPPRAARRHVTVTRSSEWSRRPGPYYATRVISRRAAARAARRALDHPAAAPAGMVEMMWHVRIGSLNSTRVHSRVTVAALSTLPPAAAAPASSPTCSSSTAAAAWSTTSSTRRSTTRGTPASSAPGRCGAVGQWGGGVGQ